MFFTYISDLIFDQYIIDMANLIRLVVSNYNDILKNVKGKLINIIKKVNLKKECYSRNALFTKDVLNNII